MKQVYIKNNKSNIKACLYDIAEVFKFDLQSNLFPKTICMKNNDEINNLDVMADYEKTSVRAALRFTDDDAKLSKMNQVSTKSDMTFTRLENCFKEASYNAVFSNNWKKYRLTTKKHEKEGKNQLIVNIDSSMPLCSLTTQFQH